MRKRAFEVIGRRPLPIVRFDYDEKTNELTVETAHPVSPAVPVSLVHVENGDTDEREMVRVDDHTYTATITGWSGYIVASG